MRSTPGYYGATLTDFATFPAGIQAGKVLGLPGTTTPTALYVGELFSAVLASDVSLTGDNSYNDLTGLSFSLTTGRYLVGFTAAVNCNRTSGNAAGSVAVRDGSNNVIAGLVAGWFWDTTVGQQLPFLSLVGPLNPSATTTYKLSARTVSATNSATSILATNVSSGLTDPDFQTIFWALRVA